MKMSKAARDFDRMLIDLAERDQNDPKFSAWLDVFFDSMRKDLRSLKGRSL